jgi:Ca2+-binding EF-hand superfamily protein
MFMQVVLNFQLKNHEKLLRPLVNAFKLKDKDADGIVGEDEFIAIIELLVEDAGALSSSLLDIVDPYETKVITFTQMVRLVANYPEDNPILNRYSQTENEVP